MISSKNFEEPKNCYKCSKLPFLVPDNILKFHWNLNSIVGATFTFTLRWAKTYGQPCTDGCSSNSDEGSVYYH